MMARMVVLAVPITDLGTDVDSFMDGGVLLIPLKLDKGNNP